jgi:hypothetical protein
MRFNPMVGTVLGLALAAALAGCGLGDELAGTAPTPTTPLVTVVVADISGSTLARRGAYVADAMTAIDATAELGGAVYLAAVDGRAIDDGWQLHDRRFATRLGGGNVRLVRAARRRQAERLRPRVQRLLRAHGQPGSDVLAMLSPVRQLLCRLPGVERRVLVISDGAVNAGGVNLARRPPMTRIARRDLIARLRRRGELVPDLRCSMARRCECG